MFKKRVSTMLCAGMLCAGLLLGCGQTQSGGVRESLYAFEKVTADDIVDVAEDLLSEMEKTKDEVVAELTAKVEKEDKGQGEADASELLGTWETTFSYAAVIEEELEVDEEFAGFHEDFDLTVYLTFYDDNTFAMYIDEAETEPALKSYTESLARYSTDAMYDMFKDTGMSNEELDSMMEETFGMGLYDYLIEELTSALTVEDLAGDFYEDGVYEVKGNRLYLGEYEIDPNTYDIFTIKGNTLTLMIPEGSEVEETGIEGLDYPHVFTRVE